MITINNYFQEVNSIDFDNLSSDLKESYDFMKEVTQDYTTWEYYNEDPDIKKAIDNYLKKLNAVLAKMITKESKKATPKITTEQAYEYAKDLIRVYVHRGDNLQSLISGQMGAANSQYSARIKTRKINVYQVERQKVDFTFDLQKVYNDVASEVPNLRTTKEDKKSPSIKNRKEAKAQAQASSKPVRISYDKSKAVERIDESVKFIKRFTMLHNRTKTKSQVLNFINALQRAIVEKRIRKTSPFAKEIAQIQNQLVTSYKAMKQEMLFKIGEKSLAALSAISGSEKIRFSVQYLKRFIGIQGKQITKEKAIVLYELVSKAIANGTIQKSDPYFSQVKKVLSSLKTFTSMAKKGETIEVHEEALNGLNQAVGCCCKDSKEESLNGFEMPLKPKINSGVMSIEQAKQKRYQTVPLMGKWLQLFGRFCLPTQFFVHGIGGSGKSSFVLLFTQYLASLGYRILYVAGEQFDTPTFTELLNRLNIQANDNFQIVKGIDVLSPAQFDFVVLDSKDYLEVDIQKFIALMQKYPNQSFIVLSQSIKSGNFTGSERWRNVVDVMVLADNGVIRTGHDKNRWGGAGEMKIFERPNYLQAA